MCAWAVTDNEYIMLNKIQHILCPLEAYGLVGEIKNAIVLRCGVPVCELVYVWGGQVVLVGGGSLTPGDQGRLPRRSDV